MTWAVYALLSALFGALVAILGKIGVRDVDSNLAVAIRTVIIVFFAWGIVLVQGNARDLWRISRHSYVFLILSAVATGLSWLFYYKALKLGEASRVAPIDKLSVALAVGGETYYGECVGRGAGGGGGAGVGAGALTAEFISLHGLDLRLQYGTLFRCRSPDFVPIDSEISVY
jgi:transporter family protein